MNAPLLENLEYFTNHVFMPLQLPSKDDHTPEKDMQFCSVVLDIMKRFQATLSAHDREILRPVIGMLRRLYNSHELDKFEAGFLTDQIKTLEDDGISDIFS
jgi:hypothetical protein